MSLDGCHNRVSDIADPSFTTMALSQKDLEYMMAIQTEERLSEIKVIKALFMEGVKNKIKKQLCVVKDELKQEIASVRNELDKKISDLELQQTEISDVQSITGL